MDKFNMSILEYLGRLEDGVLVLLSIIYEDVYYEATYFYTSAKIVLTVDDSLTEKLGYNITEDKEYPTLISNIINKVVSYDKIYSKIHEVDFSRWFKLEDED